MIRSLLIPTVLMLLSTQAARGQTLLEAIDAGDLATVERILSEHPSLLNAPDEGGHTPLNWAAYRGKVEVVRRLLALGADASIADSEHHQPIHNAAAGGYTGVIETLLASGVDINTPGANGMTALLFSISSMHPEAAGWLLDRGADPTLARSNGLTALHYAALRGFPDLIERLVALGIDVNVQTQALSTPLLHASASGHAPAVLKLLELGADIELANDYGRTPLLYVARESGDAEMARLLVEHGANVDALDIYDDSPLVLAAWRGFSAIVDLLLDSGADVPTTGTRGLQLIRYSAERGLSRLMTELVERGADLTLKDGRGGTLLHSAASGGSAEIVRLLVEQGLVVDAVDRFGWTPLHYAAARGRLAVAQILTDRGAEINARTLSGYSALGLATEERHRAVADFLAAHGADRPPRRFAELTGPYFDRVPPTDTAELFAPDIVTSNWGEHSNVTFSPDGTEAFWTPYTVPSDSGYGHSRIVGSRIENGHWTAPEVPAFTASSEDGGDVPVFSHDGNRLYFLSTRPLTPGGPRSDENVWIVDRTTDGWGEPYPAPGELNSVSMHWQFTLTNSGTVYFAGRGPDDRGMGDIYKSTLVNGRYSLPVNLGDVINTPRGETTPYIAPDESYLLFASSGHGGSGGTNRVYISWNDGAGGWTEPVFAGITGLCPMVTSDGAYLFYKGPGDLGGIHWRPAAFLQNLRPAGS